MASKCCIIIPVYHEPTDIEIESIKQTVIVVGNIYDIYVISPRNLQLSNTVTSLYNFNILRFPEYYFINNITYSVLLEQPSFWESFSKYDWAMIIQTDAWIFRNEIEHYIQLGYDYYGGPWLEYIWYNDKNYNSVGNGGFSLRKVSKMLEITKKYGPQIVDYSYATPGANLTLGCSFEDAYFCLIHKDELNLCPFEIACNFCADEKPIDIFRINGNKLPMGGHRIFGPDARWWAQFIKPVANLLQNQNNGNTNEESA